MNTKLIGLLIVVIFVVLIGTYSWNSNAVLPSLGAVTTLEVTHNTMTGAQRVGFDASGKITATQTTYAGTSTTQTKTGTLSEAERRTIIALTLQKHDATRIESDRTPGPDENTSRVQFEADGKKYDLRCATTESACSKLADELLSNFASILSHQ